MINVNGVLSLKLIYVTQLFKNPDICIDKNKLRLWQTET